MISLIVYSTDSKRFHKFKTHPQHTDLNIIRIKNAKTVAEAYQGIKQYEQELRHSDKLIFVHDDVFFRDNIVKREPAIDNLLSTNPKTIIGLAGTKYFDVRVSPCWWQNNQRPNSLVGIVDHSEIKNGFKNTWTSSFGNYDKIVSSDNFNLPYSEVKVVDGLFLMMKKEYAFSDNPFKTARGNHFYDVRASLASNNVFAADFRCVHEGLGDSMFSNDYTEEAQRLCRDVGTQKI